MKYRTNRYISLFVMVVLFTTCKKYPENKLWFKNPYKIAVINGYMTEYKVNGIDSLDLLNSYYKPIVPNGIYPYNKTTRDIKQEHFQACCAKNGYWQVTSDLYLFDNHLEYEMQKDKKTIRIAGSVDTLYYTKQLFIDTKGVMDWQIQYLDKKGRMSKFKTIYKGNTYEITFKN